MCKLELTEHDYIRVLKSQSCKQMPSLSRKDSVGPGIRGYKRPGFYSHRRGGDILSLDFFSRCKASAANIGIIAIFVYQQYDAKALK